MNKATGTLLQQLADESPYLHIHLDIQPLYGGDPLAIVEAACKKAREHARSRGVFVGRAVLLDGDRLGRDHDRDRSIDRLAKEHRILLVWQHPCHEALLLHHLPDCQSLQPASSAAAKAALEHRWPGYYKGIAASRLRERIGFAEIRAAASAETGLRDLLSSLGFRLTPQ